MNPTRADIGSTIAGGAAGLTLLITVQWTAIPHGEEIKVGVAMALVLLGYLFHHGPDVPPTTLRPIPPNPVSPEGAD